MRPGEYWIYLCVILGVVSIVSAGEPADNHLLRVVGNRLVDGKGQVVRLTGVNVPSLEWSNEGEHVLRSIHVACEEWHANAIRLPLSQDRWFGHARGQKDGGAAYRKIVDAAIHAAAERDAYTILDLHWSNAGVWGRHIGQHDMPDLNSLVFWEHVAERYKNHPRVLFSLYNEPRNITWPVWKHGDETITGDGPDYTAVGMQTLVDKIRETGAKNVISASGIDWGFDLSGIADGYALSDPNGHGILYETHIYPWKGDEWYWEDKVGRIKNDHPILIGEAGHTNEAQYDPPEVWCENLLNWADANGIHWTAWSFHPTATPALIRNWEYTPTPHSGIYFKDRLAHYVRDADK